MTQTTWNSPFGSPASSSREMPVANGKFQGAMIPTTPLGCRISVDDETSGTGPPRRFGASSFGARLR